MKYRNRISQTTVAETLISWGIRFKSAGYTQKDIKHLCYKFEDDLNEEGFDDELFVECAKLVQRRTKFFPQFSELLEVRAEAENIIKRRKSDTLLEHKPFKESATLDEAEERIQIVKDLIAGNISSEEAVSRQSEIAERITSSDRGGVGDHSIFIKSLVGQV